MSGPAAGGLGRGATAVALLLAVTAAASSPGQVRPAGAQSPTRDLTPTEQVGTPRPLPPPGAVPSWCERTATGYRCVAGPVAVPPNQTVELMTGVAAPSEAGYLTSARASLVDAEGQEIAPEAVHLHHAVWLNPTRRDLTCDAYDDRLPDYERFFASGKERTPVVLPDGYGYYWSNGGPQPHTQSAPGWGMVAMLDGRAGKADVFIELEVGFVPEGQASGMTAIRPVWLDVRNCSSNPVYDVPRGSGEDGVHRESWTHELALGGRFVFLGGHLHDGGLALELRNATTGDELFTSRPVYGRPDDPWGLTGMTTMSDPAGPTVDAGDRLRLTAAYDSARARPNVMGIMLGALVPARSDPAQVGDRGAPPPPSSPRPPVPGPQRLLGSGRAR
jgi:hypothetical protein